MWGEGFGKIFIICRKLDPIHTIIHKKIQKKLLMKHKKRHLKAKSCKNKLPETKAIQ